MSAGCLAAAGPLLRATLLAAALRLAAGVRIRRADGGDRAEALDSVAALQWHVNASESPDFEQTRGSQLLDNMFEDDKAKMEKAYSFIRQRLEVEESRNQTKVIYYNGRFGGPGQGRLSRCPCRVTYDSTEMFTSEAVIWNEAGMLSSQVRPIHKPAGQKWIFAFWFEPPNRNYDYEVWKRRETAWLDEHGIIDWTMSYSHSSDFHWPSTKVIPLRSEYGLNGSKTQLHLRRDNLIEPSEPSKPPRPSAFERVHGGGAQTTSKAALDHWRWRDKILLAFVSNCEGGRVELLNRLKDLLPPGTVDIFGLCGAPSPCRGRNEGDNCHQRLFSKYRFYAAFENKRFRGYISEKLFRGLLEGMVPLANGGVERKDYEALGVPKDALVHVDDFNSTKELAHFLIKSADDKDSKRYFAWRQDYRVATQWETRVDAFCDVCKELYKAPEDQKPRRTFGNDLVAWWFDQPESAYTREDPPWPKNRTFCPAAKEAREKGPEVGGPVMYSAIFKSYGAQKRATEKQGRHWEPPEELKRLQAISGRANLTKASGRANSTMQNATVSSDAARS